MHLFTHGRSIVSLALLVVLGANGATFAEDYRLGVMDKLRVKVAEWQTAEGTVRDWSVVSGDYTVGPSGTLSFPFIGDMPAEGQTTTAIADAIGLELQKKFGLKDRPSASVELAQFRPVFLSGDVETPGEYPFAPNLTVLKAVSLSGGLRRADAGQRFARDFINAKGDTSVYIAERARLLVRLARLRAETAESDTIEMPEEIKNLADSKKLMDSEAALMTSREKRLTLQLKALADLKALLQSQVDALAKKTETQTRQLQLVKEDRDKVEGLAEKGLVLSARKLATEQRTADLEATLLDIDTNSLKAKQDISKANQDEITLRNDRDADLAQQLQDTETELDTLQLKMATSNALMSEALAQSAEAARTDASGSGAQLVYSIVREEDGKNSEIPAQENTAVMPGDLIKVTVAVAMR